MPSRHGYTPEEEGGPALCPRCRYEWLLVRDVDAGWRASCSECSTRFTRDEFIDWERWSIAAVAIPSGLLAFAVVALAFPLSWPIAGNVSLACAAAWAYTLIIGVGSAAFFRRVIRNRYGWLPFGTYVVWAMIILITGCFLSAMVWMISVAGV